MYFLLTNVRGYFNTQICGIVRITESKKVEYLPSLQPHSNDKVPYGGRAGMTAIKGIFSSKAGVGEHNRSFINKLVTPQSFVGTYKRYKKDLGPFYQELVNTDGQTDNDNILRKTCVILK
ncbi:hypothetical protein J6590_053915 [Homalodisca vitripennis]|nr:hypothetical protein J6590_053915 [Homalodisca vitripennis]